MPTWERKQKNLHRAVYAYRERKSTFAKQNRKADKIIFK